MQEQQILHKVKGLPTLIDGRGNFEAFHTEKAIYVDKTDLLYNLLTNETGTIFLARPRRFGKTLLVYTLENIFQGRKELFKNLAISDSEHNYKFKRHHVIRLNMINCGDVAENINQDILRLINRKATEYGISLSNSECGPAIAELVTALNDSYKNIPLIIKGRKVTVQQPEVTVLIDEYDYPLIANLRNEDNLEKIQIILRSFYTSLKQLFDDSRLRFIFITGILRLKEYSAFSGIMQATDISYDSNYSTICGFTPDEIKLYFADYLEYASKKMIEKKHMLLNSTSQDVFNSILEWYDGYSWDGEKKVINPKSVIQFFRELVFKRYWYSSVNPFFLHQLQKKDKNYFNVFHANQSYETEIPYHDLNTISPSTALLQTGYLTIDRTDIIEIKGKPYTKIKYILGIPNTEIRNDFAKDFLIKDLFPKATEDQWNDILILHQNFCHAFDDMLLDQASLYLSSIFARIPYADHLANEAFYRSHFSASLIHSKGKLTRENMDASGIADITLEFPKATLVVEVKFHSLPESSKNNIEKVTFVYPGDLNAIDSDNISSNQTNFNIKTETLILQNHIIPPKQRHPLQADDTVNQLLVNGIHKAFEQIATRGYPLKFLGQNKDVWAIAISVVNPTFVMIERRKVIYNT